MSQRPNSEDSALGRFVRALLTRADLLPILGVVLLIPLAVLGFTFGRAWHSADGSDTAFSFGGPAAMATATATTSPIVTVTPYTTSSPTATSTPVATNTPAPAKSPTATPVPSNTPTPRPPTPTPFPRVPSNKVTKMGVGVYLHGGGHAINTLIRAQPTVILLQDPDPAFAQEVRYWFPKAFIIGRLFLAEQPLDNPEQRGTALADRIAQLAVPLKDTVNAWQSYNEPVSAGDFNGYRAYNTLQVAFARRLQDHYGIPAVAGNDPPGTVEPADYPKYYGEAIRASRYFGVHSYGGPGADTFNTPDAQYYSLRHRLIHNAFEAAGIKNVPMILTETGLGWGWRDHVSEETMASEYMWLADELDKDPYVIGMAIFGLFTDDRWRGFNIMDTGIIDLIGHYVPHAASGQH